MFCVLQQSIELWIKSIYFLLDHNQQKDHQDIAKESLSQMELGICFGQCLWLWAGERKALSLHSILTVWEALELTCTSHSCCLLSPPGKSPCFTLQASKRLVMQCSHTFTFRSVRLGSSCQHLPLCTACHSLHTSTWFPYVCCYKSKPFVHQGCHRIGQEENKLFNYDLCQVLKEDINYSGRHCMDWDIGLKGTVGLWWPIPCYYQYLVRSLFVWTSSISR